MSNSYWNMSRHSREKQFHRIELKRKSKRWLKKLLIAVVIILAVAVALSYVFISKDKDPEGLELREKPLPWMRL